MRAALVLLMLFLSGLSAAASEEEIAAFLQGKNVLIVDDNRTVLKIWRATFEKEFGMRVFAIDDPNDALMFMDQPPFPIDVLVTDYLMPQMTGGDLAYQLKEMGSDTPMILATATPEAVSPRHFDLFSTVVVKGQKTSVFGQALYHAIKRTHFSSESKSLNRSNLAKNSQANHTNFLHLLCGHLFKPQY